MRAIAIAILAVLTTSCATSQGFDRGRLEQQLAADKVEITDEEISRILKLKPQIKFPIRLGVYLKASPYSWSDLEWNLDKIDDSWVMELKKAGIISDVVLVSPLTVAKDDLKNIRMGAARHGADVVLVVDSAYDIDRYNNVSAFLYLTIIGGYFVPGTHADALVLIKGAMWDVRNEYLYLTVGAEGEASKVGPAFLLENSESIRLAQDDAIEGFKKEFIKRMNNLRGK